MSPIKILWTDDEIDLLQPHVLFLKDKGYEVATASNGEDAIRAVADQKFDLIFLDENMPGLSGLETLSRIKEVDPTIPVVMITKSEEENIMDEAIGSNISDYLIKPVKPNQILLSIKKHTDTKRLVRQKATMDYQSQFAQLGLQINEAHDFKDWADIYKRLTFWELELEQIEDASLREILQMQKNEANYGFSKYVRNNYQKWFDDRNRDKPLLSPSVLANEIFPLVDRKEKVFLVLIDNLRYDQWKAMYRVIKDYFTLDREDLYCSILPTTTQYSRNAFFAGLMPRDIEELYPSLWRYDEEEGGKNLNEQDLLVRQLQRLGKNYKFKYEKISNQRAGNKLLESIPSMLHNDLNVLVYNFVDMLSHARTDMEMIRELAGNEAAYRSLTLSWFQHSHLLDLVREISGKGVKLVITTDHGSIQVNNPIKVVGDRKTTANIRYKQGKNLNYKRDQVYEIKRPESIRLPKSHLSSTYIFAYNNDFMVYPNNYNQYVNYYRNTFQHGGISIEEMLIPLVILS